MTVTNNAGKPIEDIRIAIQPVGAAPPFTWTVRRMENAEKREISVGEFRSNDGATFSPRILNRAEGGRIVFPFEAVKVEFLLQAV